MISKITAAKSSKVKAQHIEDITKVTVTKSSISILSISMLIITLLCLLKLSITSPRTPAYPNST
jgi:hypothetical protein